LATKEDNKLLCDVSDLEEHWNVTSSKVNNNVRRRYLGNPKKIKQVEIIDIGVFCIKNDITRDMLHMAVRHIKEVAALVTHKELKEKNKVIVLSEEEYKEYQQFKKFSMIHEKIEGK
jgi:hypothetical protein